jgi:2-haloacid dehalogenase
MRTPKALFFDVFGTCVDWRTTVIRAGAAYGLPPAYADDWRGRYQPQLETVRNRRRTCAAWRRSACSPARR